MQFIVVKVIAEMSFSKTKYVNPVIRQELAHLINLVTEAVNVQMGNTKAVTTWYRTRVHCR